MGSSGRFFIAVSSLWTSSFNKVFSFSIGAPETNTAKASSRIVFIILSVCLDFSRLWLFEGLRYLIPSLLDAVYIYSQERKTWLSRFLVFVHRKQSNVLLADYGMLTEYLDWDVVDNVCHIVLISWNWHWLTFKIIMILSYRPLDGVLKATSSGLLVQISFIIAKSIDQYW